MIPNSGVLQLRVADFGRARRRAKAFRFAATGLVIGGTLAALIAIPGDPGNAERHRATQTVPLLIVLASGFVASRRSAISMAGRPVSNASSMPKRATTAVSSSRRSAR